MTQRYIVIGESHVGKQIIRAFGRVWLVSGFIGRIMAQDVGKRVYLVDGILQVENDEQMKTRKAQETL